MVHQLIMSVRSRIPGSSLQVWPDIACLLQRQQDSTTFTTHIFRSKWEVKYVLYGTRTQGAYSNLKQNRNL